jgi:benzil reductase ((S)-benzoin forming)
MNYYYITGTSRGIGKALAELLLKDNQNFVTGISRTNPINHSNYRHVQLDLSDTAKTEEFEFQNHKDAERIVLVNNAGYIGEIKRAGNHKDKTLIDSINVNLTAPIILTNKFIKTYGDSPAGKIILNVSSGAARHAVDAWSAYSASKTGLDMFSKVIAEEQKITGSGFKIISVGPGVVDTGMQKMLRESDENEFSRKADFVGYKEKNQLASTEYVSRKYFEILENINNINETVFSVKEYESMQK